ncbi:MAG: hypothetical protein FWC39_10320 [Bacteroidetes bacterium]|nr:hypothetical protein [Bacteroidota bacterium]
MKLKLFTLTAFLGLFLGANAQINLDQRIKKEGVVKGVIIKNGKEEQGYIKKIAETRRFLTNGEYKDYQALDNFQYFMYFIPKSEFESAEKIKNNMYIKYRPEAIEGYKYIYPDGTTLVYETVMYSDKSSITLKMIPQPVFVRVESTGRLNIYTYYIPPSQMGTTLEEVKGAEEPQTLFRKAGEKEAKAIYTINIEKDLADCPKVVAKFKNGEYNVIGKKGSDSKLVKIANKLNANDEMKLAALMEYNEGLCD